MRDPHLNVFHAYRGPGADPDRPGQLEDNLTRALAAVLLRLRGSAAAEPILDALHVPRAGRDTFDVQLQVGRLPDRHVAQRDMRIVVLHAGPTLEVDETRAGDRDRGRPDVVLFGRNWTVAIESKLGNRVSADQIAGHRLTLRAETAPVISTTWMQVAEAVRVARRQVKRSPVQSFLLAQFEEYLAMTGFGGLVEEQFAYLALGAEDRDRDTVTKDGIRRSLALLADAVRERWARTWEPHLGKIRTNSTGAWAIIRPPGSRHPQPHLTISMTPAGIGVFANIETEGPWRIFRNALRRAPGPFIEFLRGLDPPGKDEPKGWRFEVLRRVGTDRPRDYLTPPGLTIGAGAIGNLPQDALLSMVVAATAKPPREAAPEIMVLRRYDAAAVVRQSELPNWLVADARALTPFFEWLGGGVR
ncbi:MAG: hypothetical protein HY905_06860 [Deltaproteobacteria bacterium]|nr:hypothetical protein [Deltaproteobacteria bacterium]